MKTSLSILLLSVSILWSTGCARLQPGADPAAVRAEQTVEASMETINSFLDYEEKNRALINSQECKAFADRLRLEVPAAFSSYMQILSTYKASRTPENKLLLEGAIQVFDAFQAQALVWVNKYGRKPAGPGAYELIMLAMAGISSLIKLISDYKRVAEKSEEWTDAQQSAFREQWTKIMNEASHWKIVPLLLLAGILAAGTWSSQAQTNPVVKLTWSQADSNATEYAVYEISGHSLQLLATVTTNYYSFTITPGWHYYTVTTFVRTDESAPANPLQVCLLRRPPTYSAGTLTLNQRQTLFAAQLPGTNCMEWAVSTDLIAPTNLVANSP